MKKRHYAEMKMKEDVNRQRINESRYNNKATISNNKEVILKGNKGTRGEIKA